MCHVGLTALAIHSLCVSLAGAEKGEKSYLWQKHGNAVGLISVSLRCAAIEGGNHRCRSVNVCVGLYIKFAGGEFDLVCVASVSVQVRQRQLKLQTRAKKERKGRRRREENEPSFSPFPLPLLSLFRSSSSFLTNSRGNACCGG